MKALQAVSAADFKRTNGIVMRTIANVFSTRFFEVYELEAALKARNIDDVEINESLDYLEGKGYIEVRHMETKNPVRLCDMDKDDIEIKLSSEGKLVVLSIKLDDGIDM
jgi:hypothetical protein